MDFVISVTREASERGCEEHIRGCRSTKDVSPPNQISKLRTCVCFRLWRSFSIPISPYCSLPFAPSRTSCLVSLLDWLRTFFFFFFLHFIEHFYSICIPFPSIALRCIYSATVSSSSWSEIQRVKSSEDRNPPRSSPKLIVHTLIHTSGQLA